MEAPYVPPSEELSFRTELRTRWSDEDNHGVLNNAVYLTLFEEARHAYFSRLGMLSENRFPFVLLATNVRFLRPGRGGETVALEMATTGLGTTSFTQVYRVLDAGGEAWCEGEAVCVLVDPRSGRPVPIPAAFRSRVVASEPALG